MLTVHEAISRAAARRWTPTPAAAALPGSAERQACRSTRTGPRAQSLLELYERLVEHATVEPTFYLDFPTDVSPLTRPHRDDPRLAERWDLVAFGTEIATAYSELVDPLEQRRRLTEQSLLAAGGDPEAMQLDEDFLTRWSTACPRRAAWGWASTGW